MVNYRRHDFSLARARELGQRWNERRVPDEDGDVPQEFSAFVRINPEDSYTYGTLRFAVFIIHCARGTTNSTRAPA